MLTLYFNKQQKESSLCERLKELGGDMFYTDYAGDIVNLLVNKPRAYRFLYDAQADLYIICDAWDYTHLDMVEEAFYAGLYASQEEFCNAFVGNFNSRSAYSSYFSSALGLCPLDGFSDEEIELISDTVDRDGDTMYPWLYCFAFIPPNSDSYKTTALKADGYDYSTEFSFGTVYTRDFELSECDELQSALRRADK